MSGAHVPPIPSVPNFLANGMNDLVNSSHAAILTILSITDFMIFCELFTNAQTKCSNENVKEFRVFIERTTSRHDLETIIKYMTVQSFSCTKRRRQLYTLYIINDILHHDKFSNDLEWPLLCLFSLAWKCASNRDKLQELALVWKTKNLVDSTIVDKLFDSSKMESDEYSIAKLEFSAQCRLPDTFGDNNRPYYELPASLMLKVESINSGRTVNSSEIRPIKLQNKELGKVLEEFYSDACTMKKEGYSSLGSKYTYEGWTREFVNDRKERHEHAVEQVDEPAIINNQSYNAVAPPAEY